MLAITGSRTTTIALAATVLLLFLGGTAYFMLRRPPRKGTPDIPPAMKPGPADAQLEKPRLERMQAWGIVTVVLMAIWMPAVWLHEPKQNESDQRTFNAQSVAAGMAGAAAHEFTLAYGDLPPSPDRDFIAGLVPWIFERP